MKAFLIASTTELLPFGKPEGYDTNNIPGALHTLKNLYFRNIRQQSRDEAVLITFSEEEKAEMMKKFSAYLPLLKERYHMFYILRAIIQTCTIGDEDPPSIASWYYLNPVMFKLTRSDEVPMDFGILLWAPPSDDSSDAGMGICFFTQD